ncbi:hypothetical protein GSF22_33635, partial [Micromonospora echinofusca]|nr:hypothetical protein [Micromonospora echinofusca]
TILRYPLAPAPSSGPPRATPAPTPGRDAEDAGDRADPAEPAGRAERAGPRDATRAIVVGGLGLFALGVAAAVRTRRRR